MIRSELLRMEHISKYESGVKRLDDLSLHLFKGEVLGILGHSLAGKTQIVSILAGLDDDFEGAVYFKDEFVQDFHDMRCHCCIQCIFITNGLIPALSVAENIFEIQPGGAFFHYVNSSKICKQTREMLKLFQLEYINPKTQAQYLSRFEQCLIQLIKVYMMGPELIVLDTIFEGLSAAEQTILQDTISMMKKQGFTFLITGRLYESLMSVSDRIAVLESGHIIKWFYRQDFSEEIFHRLLLGRKYNHVQYQQYRGREKEVFKYQNITMNRITDFQLSIHRGEVVGLWDIMNETNCALCRLLMGQVRQYQGEMYLNEKRFFPKEISDSVRRGIAVIDHDSLQSGLIDTMNVVDNILLPTYRRLAFKDINRGLFQFLADEYALSGDVDIVKSKAGEVEVYDKYRTLMGKWLLYKPFVLLYISPKENTDVISLGIIREYIQRLAANGTGIIIASSDLNYLCSVCNRVIGVSDEIKFLK